VDERDAQAILGLVTGKLSESEFLARYPVDPRRDPEHVRRLLEAADESRNADDVEYALLLGFRFGFPDDVVPILNRLLVEDWHRQHENIAQALTRFRDPSSVDSLYRAALSRHEYLAYDDAFALAVKCIWALAKIDTPEARERLRALATSDNDVIREEAEKRLARLQ
jgi:hypothetical protein